MSAPTDTRYWFAAKTYGWGWGLPLTWEGWVSLIVWAAVLFTGIYRLRHQHQSLELRLGYVTAMSLVLVLICYWKGEPPGWRWGKPPT
jgi:hypothetical protein